jgi:hypothetical protein
MEIIVCYPGQKIIQADASWKRWLYNKLTILCAQAYFSTSAKANLLSQTTRDPHAKAVSPFLDPRLHGKITAIRRVYQLWTAAAYPPSL